VPIKVLESSIESLLPARYRKLNHIEILVS
jgi:hypothetical protein